LFSGLCGSESLFSCGCCDSLHRKNFSGQRSLAVKHLILSVALLVSIGVGGQTDKIEVESNGCRKSLTVNQFLLPDDAAAAKRALSVLQSALLHGDRKQVIELINFPVTFVISGYPVTFATAHELAPKYKTVFTDYVILSVREQEPDGLLAGWDGVSLSNGAVKFSRTENETFRITDVMPKHVRPPEFIADFLERQRVCPPVVVEGRIAAYNWVTHMLPGFENIYADHFIVDITRVVSGRMPQKRIRVDFWGITNLPEYNLPLRAFEPGAVWRMYLRPDAEPPNHDEVCGKDVQEWISSVDLTGREFAKQSAIKVLTDEGLPSYTNLSCFEANKQFFSEVVNLQGRPDEKQ
jgi:hypothetical protein